VEGIVRLLFGHGSYYAKKMLFGYSRPGRRPGPGEMKILRRLARPPGRNGKRSGPCTKRRAVARAAAPRSKLSARDLDAALWGGSLEREHETGRFDSRGFYRRVAALAGFEPSYSYEEFAGDYRRIILPNPDGEAGLITARDRGARCFVLSNTSFLHARMIFENEVLASIPELHILSYKVGLMKPDPRIWLKLLEYTGLDAGDCLYIDDVEAYCDAARGLGFGVFCYDRNTHFLSQILQDVLK